MREADETTVVLQGRPQGHGVHPEEVTVCVPGASLAPAPSALVTHAARITEAPVFVDDSGTRKRLVRLAGVLVAMLSVGFLALVGVAVAVPSVATSVGFSDAVPFLVPGAAAKPPAKTVPDAPKVAVAPPVVHTVQQAPTRSWTPAPTTSATPTWKATTTRTSKPTSTKTSTTKNTTTSTTTSTTTTTTSTSPPTSVTTSPPRFRPLNGAAGNAANG